MPTLRAPLAAACLFIAGPVLAQTPAPLPAPPPPPPAPAAATPGPGALPPEAPNTPGPAPSPGLEAVTPGPEGGPAQTPSPGPLPIVTPGAADPSATPTDDAPAFPEKVMVGKNGGFWQPGALLQFWLLGQRENETTTTTVRLRRAELRMKGEIMPKLVGYNLMIDPAKLLSLNSSRVPVLDADGMPTGETVSVPSTPNDRSVLQDFFITFISDYVDVSLGQFKIPVSLEGYGGSSKLLFPERARVARKYGDRRDLGIRAEKKLGDYFYYYAGVFNGAGQNQLDNDNEKDVALRLEAYPIKGLTVGAVGYTTVGERDENVRDRVEGDLRLELDDFIFQGEYIHAWDGAARVEGHGAYGAIGYTFLDRIQPVVRVGFVDSNIDSEVETDAQAGTSYEGVINYFIQGHEAKLALAISVLDRPEESEAEGGTLTEGILFAQVSF